MFSNSVSSRSVLARRCSRETATLEGWRSGQGTAPARIFAGEEVIRIADLKAEDSPAAKLSPDVYLACPNDRPNHVGIAVQRHIRAGRIQERDGKLYATSPAAQATV